MTQDYHHKKAIEEVDALMQTINGTILPDDEHDIISHVEILLSDIQQRSMVLSSILNEDEEEGWIG